MHLIFCYFSIQSCLDFRIIGIALLNCRIHSECRIFSKVDSRIRIHPKCIQRLLSRIQRIDLILEYIGDLY